MKTKERSTSWLTVPQAAEELQILRTRWYELIQRGELPGSLGTAKRVGFTPAELRGLGTTSGLMVRQARGFSLPRMLIRTADRGEGHR
jgi:hypothetical protein